ncbi:trichohyalin [Solea solea]|uniref:trichohyalin n=1 Tax=Solea solea TaxID=90069 RepID=UPI002729DDB4|nr:trichohyalin [Solea solea]
MSFADPQWCPTSVQVTVLQARGLRSKGKSGTNDAYAVMQVGKEKFQTSVVEKSVAPVWKEEATFDLSQSGGGGKGTLHVHVLHRALVGPDKPLGHAVVDLLCLSEDKTRNKTEWFKLLDKTGKADKDRGEVLLDIQFMRNNMTASMFDLSAAGKSRSRLGKFKDKVRGKKKESDAVSGVVPSFNQVLTDSEEEANDEEAAGKDEKKKKHKMKSLFSSKSNLQRNMSQSMSVLPAKTSSLSRSQSSGLNVDSSEGKKKFKFKIHKRLSSSDGKDSSSGLQKHGGTAEQSNLCINGSHVYCDGSNFSLSSSGHGSMEDVPGSSPPSVNSLKAVTQYSPWTEEEEEEETAEVENITEDVDEEQISKEKNGEEERMRMQEEALEKMAEETRRREEEEIKRIEEEKVKEEERARRGEERERLAEEKRRHEEQERKRNEEEEERQREERMKKEGERRRLEEERQLAQEARRKEEERQAEEEKVRKEEEERVFREEERRRREEEEKAIREEEQECARLAEEKRRLEEQERKRIEEEEKIRIEEESRREEEHQLAEENRRMEEMRAEEDRVRREEERRRKEEEEMARRQEEAREMKRKLEEEERRWQEEQEKNRREEEKRLEEEERARKEREEHERLVREEKERQRIEAEEQIKREVEERIRMEDERREEQERVKRDEEQEEKKRLEEQERRRIEEDEKRQREEEERRRQEEEDRVKKENEEFERLAEEKRRVEEQERRLKDEERIRKEERRRREEEEMERLAEEKRRREEQEEKIQREEEQRFRRAKKEEEEARKLITDAEEPKNQSKTKHGHKSTMEKSAVAAQSAADVTSTNPFDENLPNNPFEDVPRSPTAAEGNAAMSSVQQGCQIAVSSEGGKSISMDEKDLINAQREKRPAPPPPGRNIAESRREQDVALQHLAQNNKQSNDKDVKTASVLPQRSVQLIAPLSQSHLIQRSPTKGTESAGKHGKRLAPSRPRSAEEESSSESKRVSSSRGNISQGRGSQTKPVPVTCGLNPFVDDDDEVTLRDDTPTPGDTRSTQRPPPVSRATDESKLKSSKVTHAPAPPPTISSTLIHPNTDSCHAMDTTVVPAPDKGANQACGPQPEATLSVQSTSLKEPVRSQSTAEVTGVKKEAPPTSSRRLLPVRPLNPLEQKSVSTVPGGKSHKSVGIFSDVQEKTKITPDSGLKGPYSQLTREELVSLLQKQENQMSERDKKISELEQYIDKLLVRVIEEQPSILMSMNSFK